MCDYSLEHMISRKAAVNETLIVTRFPSGTVGLKAAAEDCPACVTEGSLLRLEIPSADFGFGVEDVIMTKVDTHIAHRHHDAVKLEDGTTFLFQSLRAGTCVKVLMLADASAPADYALASPAPLHSYDYTG